MPPPPVRHRLLFLLLLVAAVSLPSVAPDPASEQAALLAFRAAVRPSLPWNPSSSSFCRWLGVKCDALNSTVATLRLPGKGLRGPIPASVLSNLTSLSALSLRLNSLSGPLPADLPPSLRTLSLSRNRLSGDLSPLLPLVRLRSLDLSFNSLSGAVPTALSSLRRLAVLRLQNNYLSGGLPDLPGLRIFNASYNNFSGPVPASLQGFPASSFLGMPLLCGRPLPPCNAVLAPTPAPAPAAGSGGGLSAAAIAGIAIACFAAVAIALVLFWCCCCKSRAAGSAVAAGVVAKASSPPAAEKAASPEASTPSRSVSEARKDLVFFRGSEAFDLEELLRASAEVLGKGTFGTMYRAQLQSGAVVAVKRLKEVAMAEAEFVERVEAMGAMDHPNLVLLHAYYYSRDEKLLVYDYMPLGSLSAFLHGSRGSRAPIGWERRLDIAIAAAHGVLYIHSTGPFASHGNIRSSNVLLDKTSRARVSDHACAQLAGPASVSARANGYRAPEVTDPRRVTQKADVYSFGVLLLELFTGKAPPQSLVNEDGVDLPRWLTSYVREEWSSKVFDGELKMAPAVERRMVEVLQLGVDCTAQVPDCRPAMSAVVARLEEIHAACAEKA